MQSLLQKRENSRELLLTLEMYQERVELHLDKTRCLKCDICSLVCPRGAVAVTPQDWGLEITIDPRLCVLCEICAHFCPTQAVRLYLNGRPKMIFAAQQGLAPFFPPVSKDQGKCPEPCPQGAEGTEHWCRQQQRLVGGQLRECPKHCHRCLEACPRQAFRLSPDGLATEVDPEACLRCQQCLAVCEYGALTVNPLFVAELSIDDRKCPPDCLLCIEACPVQALAREGERVVRKTQTCSYCGVCLNLCEHDAITLIRRRVLAPPGRYSHAWEEAVRRLLHRQPQRVRPY